MRRFLKIVAILALFAIVIAYVAFRILFFDPFGGARPTLDSLVPKDVDLLVRRRDLARDFEPFPMPRFFKSLRLRDEWTALESTSFFREIAPKLGVERAFADLEKLPEQIKPIDLMQDLAGREVLAFGRWRDDGTLAWAAIARGSFRAKLVAEALKLGVVRNTVGDVIKDYAEKDGVRSITAQGQRLHLARIEDALVAGNDFDLVRSIVALDADGANALDKSPQYRSMILPPSPIGRPIDFLIDVGAACKHLGLKWPPPSPDDAWSHRFLRELLAPERFGQAIGRVALGGQIELSAAIVADRVALKPAAGGLLDGTSTSLAELHDFCGKVFPAKVALAGYVRLDVKEFLRRIESLLEQDLRQLLNDFVVSLKTRDDRFQPKSTLDLLDRFAGVVGNEFAFALEPDEAYELPLAAGAEYREVLFPNPRSGPRVALIFPVAEKAGAAQLVERLVDALNGRPNAISNIWKWEYPVEGRPYFKEIKSVDADQPTVSIGLIELQKRDCIVITTTGAFLDEIYRQKFDVDRGLPTGLQSELQYRQAQEAVAGFGQGFVFVSSENLQRVLSDFCAVIAEDSTRPNWVTIRREVEQQVIAKEHPELKNRLLDESVRRQIEPEVDRIISERERVWKETTLPKRTEELRTDLGGLDIVRWLALTLRVAERDLEFKLRLATPANFATDDAGGGP